MAIVVQSGFESGSVNDLPKKRFVKPVNYKLPDTCPGCGRPNPMMLVREQVPTLGRLGQTWCEKCSPYHKEGQP